MRIGLGPTPMLYFAVNTLGGRWRHHGHRLAQPADHNGFKLVLGKKPFFGERHPAARRASPPRAHPADGSGAVRSKNSVLDDYVARLAQGLRRHATACMSPGMPATARPARSLQQLVAHAARPARPAQRDDRRHAFRRIIPIRPMPKNLVQLQEAVARAGLRSRHRLRWRRRPHRRGRRQGPDPVGRPVDGGAGARRARATSRRHRSSPMSRRARCCSTRSRAWAASR